MNKNKLTENFKSIVEFFMKYFQCLSEHFKEFQRMI